MTITPAAHRANQALKDLRRAISSGAPWNITVAAARTLIKRADELDSIAEDRPIRREVATCNIALDQSGDRLALTIPGTTGAPHTITVRLDLEGLIAIYDILRARERYREERQLANIGTVAAPVQHLVDDFLKKGGRIETEEQRAERRLRERYGDEVLDIEAEIEI